MAGLVNFDGDFRPEGGGKAQEFFVGELPRPDRELTEVYLVDAGEGGYFAAGPRIIGEKTAETGRRVKLRRR